MTTRTVPDTTLDAALAEARDAFAAAHPACRAAHEAACANLPGGNTRTVLCPRAVPAVHVARERAATSGTWTGGTSSTSSVTTPPACSATPTTVAAAIRHRTLADGLRCRRTTRSKPRWRPAVRARMPTIERVRFTNSGTEANLSRSPLPRR